MIDRAEQLGRHVGEVERLAADAGGEAVRPLNSERTKVRPRTTTPEPSTEKWSGSFDAGEAVDRDARHALQRLGDRTVGQRADVFGGDRVDDGVGVALDVLRVGEAGADAGDDDRAVFCIVPSAAAAAAGSSCAWAAAEASRQPIAKSDPPALSE